MAERLVVAGSVGSTNDEVRRLAERGAPAGTAVAAEHQAAGRGRLARAWHSPRGLGAYVSVLFRPTRPPGEGARWTLAAAVAAAEACREITGAAVGIEWPNDIVFEGRKLGGILTELRSGGTAVRELVVGAGINVLQRAGDFPPELRQSATSLRRIAPRRAPEREPVIASWLRRLVELDGRLERDEWEAVAGAWASMAVGAEGRRVRVLPGGARGGPEGFFGTTCGLAPDGALLVRRDDGSRVPVRLVDSVRFGDS